HQHHLHLNSSHHPPTKLHQPDRKQKQLTRSTEFPCHIHNPPNNPHKPTFQLPTPHSQTQTSTSACCLSKGKISRPPPDLQELVEESPLTIR
ncbi:hypothetical protein BDFB_011809, partial [Asbolus verrucosus]